MVQQRRLALLVPALSVPQADTVVSSPVEELPALDGLQSLLSRAEVRELPDAGMEAQLFRLFRLEIPDGDLPVAALTHAFDRGENVPGWRMRCDPVHLVPGHNSLVLAGSEELDISVEESALFAGQLNEFYGSRGWHVEALTPVRWYLTLPQPPRLQTSPLPEVKGRSIEGCLPRGEDARQWHALIAELQMFLHGSRINLQRESRGRPVVNSLWFWGGGTLPANPGSRLDAVWSDEVVGRALADLTDTPCSPVPESACQWLDSAAAGEHLIVLDSGRYVPRCEEMSAWLELLRLFEKNWFSPLLAMLKRGELERLEIYAGSGRLFQLTRRSLRRFWRGRSDIMTLLSR